MPFNSQEAWTCDLLLVHKEMFHVEISWWILRDFKHQLVTIELIDPGYLFFFHFWVLTKTDTSAPISTKKYPPETLSVMAASGSCFQCFPVSLLHEYLFNPKRNTITVLWIRFYSFESIFFSDQCEKSDTKLFSRIPPLYFPYNLPDSSYVVIAQYNSSPSHLSGALICYLAKTFNSLSWRTIHHSCRHSIASGFYDVYFVSPIEDSSHFLFFFFVNNYDYSHSPEERGWAEQTQSKNFSNKRCFLLKLMKKPSKEIFKTFSKTNSITGRKLQTLDKFISIIFLIGNSELNFCRKWREKHMPKRFIGFSQRKQTRRWTIAT